MKKGLQCDSDWGFLEASSSICVKVEVELCLKNMKEQSA